MLCLAAIGILSLSFLANVGLFFLHCIHGAAKRQHLANVFFVDTLSCDVALPFCMEPLLGLTPVTCSWDLLLGLAPVTGLVPVTCSWDLLL